MKVCQTPIGAERLIAYWADELTAAETDAIDEHVFACDACTQESERISSVVQAFRGAIPPVITRPHIEALRGRGNVVVESDFEPGVRKVARFERGVDVLIHRLCGLPLAGADRVAVMVRSESGDTLAVDPFAPFDAHRGEVLIACQRHFQSYPDQNVVFDVHVHRGAASTVATYFIPHLFT